MNFQMFKLVLEKAEEPEIKLLTSIGSLKKQEFQKTSTSALLTTPKSLIVWMNRTTPGLPVHHQLPEFTQTHVH